MIPFTLIEILGEYATQEGATVHQAKHDMESLIYILIWMCVLYGDPQVEGSGPCDASTTCLNAWTSPKSLPEVHNLAVFKHGDLHLRVTLQEFTDYFQGLKATAGSLYDAILQSYSDGEPELSHVTIRKILLDTFFTVQEPILQNTQRFRAGMKCKMDSEEDVVRTTKPCIQ
jgi:hypothetical protein